MIYAVAGSPGSYKSVYVLEKYIIPALKKGRQVYTNTESISALHIATYFGMSPIDVDNNLHILGRVYDEDGSFHEDSSLIRKFYENVPNNALIVIDEAQNYFSSRDFKEQFSKDVISYLTRHRHYGHDVIYITQNIDSVDITFRRNTQMTFVLKRAEHVGLKKLAIIFIYDRFNLEVKPLARQTYSPNPTCFACYSSYEGTDVEEHRKTYNVILRSKGFWAFLIGILLLLFMYASGRFDRLLHPGQSVAKPSKSSVVVSSSSVVSSDNVKIDSDLICVKEFGFVHGKPRFFLSDGSYTDRGGYPSCPGR